MTDAMQVKEALLPCPLCKASPETLFRGFRYADGSTEKYEAIMCPTCDCRAPLKSWNTRAPSPASNEQLYRQVITKDRIYYEPVSPAALDPVTVEATCRRFIDSAVRWIPSEGVKGQNGLDANETVDLITKRLVSALSHPAPTNAGEADPRLIQRLKEMATEFAIENNTNPKIHVCWLAADRLAALASPLSSTHRAEDGRVPDRETFWLLEMVDKPQWALWTSYSGDFVHSWTDDVWRAGRFNSERHAHDVWRSLSREERARWKPVEHMFINKSEETGTVTSKHCPSEEQ